MIFFLTTATVITVAEVVATVGSALIAISPLVEIAISKKNDD